MLEEENKAEGEATFAPGQDLSLGLAEMSLEDIASRLFDADIQEKFTIRYSQILSLGEEENVVECSTLDIALTNAKNLLKSPSILPHSVKVTSKTVIITPEIFHEIPQETPSPAPRYKPPAEHPNIPVTP